jgi:hypothetical protein
MIIKYLTTAPQIPKGFLQMVDTREGKTLRLPPELWQRAREVALANRRSVTREIEIAVDQYLSTQANVPATREEANR